MNESPVPVTAKALFSRSSEISLKRRRKVLVGLAGEHDRPARGVEAKHEHAVVVSRQGEVLVLVRVGGH
jgi:hypothetical protein